MESDSSGHFDWSNNRELKQARRKRQQVSHKFACLTVKNNSFARFARAFFIFKHSTDVLVLRREVTCFAVVWYGRREYMMTNVQFYLLSEARSF